jgi:hypothetical protein
MERVLAAKTSSFSAKTTVALPITIPPHHELEIRFDVGLRRHLYYRIRAITAWSLTRGYRGIVRRFVAADRADGHSHAGAAIERMTPIANR